MSKKTEHIEIYYDRAGDSVGWAWRAYIQTAHGIEPGPSGSGAIDGRAAQALDDLVEYWVLSDDQLGALDTLADAMGWDRAGVTLADVGPLWP